MKTAISLILLTFFSWQTLAAKTLVVTDIDDTLKVSHVLNKSDALFNALKTTNYFLGMPELLSEIKSQVPDVELVYLTNAPSSMMSGSHKKFLANNNFPAGQLILRGSESADTFKLNQLRQLMQKFKPEQLLLLGDDGEGDAATYAQIMEENPHTKITTFIRLAYYSKSSSEPGHVLLANEIGFVTGVDVIVELQKLNILPGASGKVLAEIGAQILAADFSQSTGALVIVPWQDCRDYQWTLPATDQFMQKIKDKISKRCQQPIGKFHSSNL